MNHIFYLFDCIDQISEERISVLNDWINQNSDKNFIVSARSSSFFKNCQNNLSEVVIKQLNNDQIIEFIKNYIEKNTDLAIEQILELKINKKKLQDLIKNPFILSFLCLLFFAKKKLPKLKGIVVRETVKAVFSKYNKERNNKYKFEQVLKALGKISLKLLKKGLNNSANIDWAINEFSEYDLSKNIIDFLSLINFIEINEKRTTFKIKHSILQEYFAAEAIFLNDYNIEEFIKKPSFSSCCRKPQPFDNVISLLFDIDDKKKLYNLLLKKDPFLLYDIINENNIIIDDFDSYKLTKEIIPSIFSDSYDEYQYALKKLVKQTIESTDLIEKFITGGLHWQKRRSLQLLGQLRNQKTAKLICESLIDTNRWVRKDAAKILRYADEELSKYINSYINNELLFKEKELMYSIGIPLIKCFEISDETIKEKLSNNYVLIVDKETSTYEHKSRNIYNNLIFKNFDDEIDIYEESDIDLYEYLYSKEGYIESLKNSLITTPYDDKLWFKKWIILIGLKRNDPELIQFGLEWLNSINENHPFWTIVWCKIWKLNTFNKELYEMGYGWVFKKYQMHKGWSYVWFELFIANTNDKNLTKLGIEWIKNREYDNDFYGYIWFSIWQVSSDRSELNELGLMLLKTISPKKLSWGFVLPRLYEENIFKEELESLGRYWLKTAENTHKAWGYIWPILWKNSVGDEELYSIGYQWIKNAPVAHGAWGYIWNELFFFNNEDQKLLQIGLEWIENAPIQHGSWSIIWHLLFDSNYQKDELKLHGLSWLKNTNIEHHGWPFIWTKLLYENYENDFLFNLGINWIKNISYANNGWGSIYPELAAFYYNDEIEEIGKKWLRNVGFEHESWSFIWESIYSNTVNKKELHKIGQKWLMNVNQHDPKWYYVWRYFFDEFKEETALQIFTMRWLEDNYENPSWKNVWYKLFDYDFRLKNLLNFGKSWLEEQTFLDTNWIDIWKNTWEKDFEKPELISLLKRNLRYSNIDSYYIYSLWNEIKDYFKDSPEYLNIAAELLRNQNVSNFYWQTTFAYITKSYSLPEDIINLKEKRKISGINDDYEDKYFEELILQERKNKTFNSEKTGIELQNMFRICKDKDNIIHFVLQWLESDTKNTKTWPFVWINTFRDAKNKDVFLSLGHKWILNKSSNSPGWALVWLEIIKRRSDDTKILLKGWEWMNAIYEKRSSWPKVWCVLNDFYENENLKLNTIGLSWINKQKEDREDASLVWLKLWEKKDNKKILQPWGFNFVTKNKKHVNWIYIFLALWSQISIRDKLRLIWEKYHFAHTDHEHYNSIKELL